MMATSAKYRIPLLAVVAVAIAVVFDHQEKSSVSVSEPIGRTTTIGISNATTVTRSAALPITPRQEIMAVADPFAPRDWQKVTAPVETAPNPVPVPAVATPVAQPEPAPVAPVLPYVFMGQFDDGGRQVVYLSRNDQTFVVTQGETIEGNYKVLAIDPRQIEFEHLSTGTKQVLPIHAPNN